MRLPELRFTIRRMMLAVAVVAFLLVLAVRANRAGRLIEELRSPVRVAAWSERGLQLVDGRTVSFPGIPIGRELSPALAETTRRGVELTTDGRVYALVEVHHWCGNDGIREHVARVDLARLLAFLGHAAAKLAPEAVPSVTPGGQFTACGWNISEFHEFQIWCRILDSRRGPPTAAVIPAIVSVVQGDRRPAMFDARRATPAALQ